MSSRGLLDPGICYFPLVHSISYFPVWFYMFSCLFKLPTPLLMSSMSAPTLLAILREQKPSEEDICQFPHLAGPISPPSIPSALMSNLSTWVWFQLSFSQSPGQYSSCSYFWGSCYNAIGGIITVWWIFFSPHIYIAHEMFLTKLLKLNLI